MLAADGADFQKTSMVNLAEELRLSMSSPGHGVRRSGAPMLMLEKNGE
jgi:hypothetical protein